MAQSLPPQLTYASFRTRITFAALWFDCPVGRSFASSPTLQHSLNELNPPVDLQSPLDTVQFELIRDLVKRPRTTGSAPFIDLHSLWTPFTSTGFKTEAATPTAHPYRLVAPRTADSASFTDPQCHLLRDLVHPYRLTKPRTTDSASLHRPTFLDWTFHHSLQPQQRIRVVSLRPERPTQHPSPILKAIWTPFTLTCIKIPDTNTASRSFSAMRSMPCLQSLQELSSKLTPCWRLTSAGVTNFKYCFTLLPNGSLRLQAHHLTENLRKPLDAGTMLAFLTSLKPQVTDPLTFARRLSSGRGYCEIESRSIRLQLTARSYDLGGVD
ncbi:hypothetical protein C8R46DRAFT_1214718 [Mycena filopes]|nr:hypothetical protein C8R46DRAFT_1214718 [Mycena filopes]